MGKKTVAPLTPVRYQFDETGARQEVALAHLVWPVWSCEVVEVRTDADRRHLERCTGRLLGSQASLSRPPGAVLIPAGLWRTEVWPDEAISEPMADAERLLSAILRLVPERLVDGRPQPVPVPPAALVDFVSAWGSLGVGVPGHPGFPFDAVALAEAVLRDLARGLYAFRAIQRAEETQAEEDWDTVDAYHPRLTIVEDQERRAFYWAQWRHWLNGRLRGEWPGSGGGVHLGFERDPQGRRAWGFRAATLAGACYAAVLFNAVRPEPLAECRNCRRLFVPSRAGQRCCPPEGGGKGRSRCSNAFNVRQYRARRQQAARPRRTRLKSTRRNQDRRRAARK
jgi:hypothetical protein